MAGMRDHCRSVQQDRSLRFGAGSSVCNLSTRRNNGRTPGDQPVPVECLPTGGRTVGLCGVVRRRAIVRSRPIRCPAYPLDAPHPAVDGLCKDASASEPLRTMATIGGQAWYVTGSPPPGAINEGQARDGRIPIWFRRNTSETAYRRAAFERWRSSLAARSAVRAHRCRGAVPRASIAVLPTM